MSGANIFGNANGTATGVNLLLMLLFTKRAVECLESDPLQTERPGVSLPGQRVGGSRGATRPLAWGSAPGPTVYNVVVLGP